MTSLKDNLLNMAKNVKIPSQNFNFKNRKLVIGGVIVVLIVIWLFSAGSSLSKNEAFLCKALGLENQYKKNPKYIKCVLGIISDKFSDELKVVEDYRKGNKADAALGGLDIYLNGNTKAKILQTATTAYSQCKKYK